jgi:hypothetical protein
MEGYKSPVCPGCGKGRRCLVASLHLVARRCTALHCNAAWSGRLQSCNDGPTAIACRISPSPFSFPATQGKRGRLPGENDHITPSAGRDNQESISLSECNWGAAMVALQQGAHAARLGKWPGAWLLAATGASWTLTDSTIDPATSVATRPPSPLLLLPLSPSAPVILQRGRRSLGGDNHQEGLGVSPRGERQASRPGLARRLACASSLPVVWNGVNLPGFAIWKAKSPGRMRPPKVG